LAGLTGCHGQWLIAGGGIEPREKGFENIEVAVLRWRCLVSTAKKVKLKAAYGKE